MTDDSLRVDVAVIKNMLSNMESEMRKAHASRKAQYEATERQGATLVKIEHRLELVENFVVENRPTLQEFRDLKLKVQGAGWLGRWLYVLAGATIGVAATLVGYWNKLFGG